MKKILLSGLFALLLTACNSGDEPVAPVPVRYFTITNGDENYPFIDSEGWLYGMETTTTPKTLYGDKTDYVIYWCIDFWEGDGFNTDTTIPDTLHIDLSGQPEGVTVNYIVKYGK